MKPRDAAKRSFASLDDVLRCVAPHGVVTASRPISADDHSALHDVELTAIASAGEQRRREFATGRALLRQLLGRDLAIPVAADRRPEIPHGWVGSLAHDRRTAVAALARATRFRALGIDIEPVAALEAAVASLVVHPDDDVTDPLVAFVLKEATYKAWSTLGGRMLEHDDVRLAARPPERSGAVFTATVEPDGVELRGRYASTGREWVALVAVPSRRGVAAR